MVRLSTKGQVTIPIQVREALGIGPGSAVEFEIVDGAVLVRPCPEPEPARSPRPWIRRLTGSATVGMSTEQIMELTRGEE